MSDDDRLLPDPSLRFGSGVIGVCDICGERQAVIVLQKERYQLCVLDFLNKSWIGSKKTPGRPLPPYRSERIWFPSEFPPSGSAPAIVLSPTKQVKRPGVLLTPDIYGLTTAILDGAIRFAREGFEVLLPDLGKTAGFSFMDSLSLRGQRWLRGRVSAERGRTRRLMGLYGDGMAALRARTLVEPDKTGVFGIGAGASLALGLAGTDRKLAAIAVANPVPVSPPEYLRLVTAPMLVVAGSRDVGARRFVRDLSMGRGPGAPTPKIVTYARVGAGFLGRDLRGYDLRSAEAAWSQVLQFLRSTLLPPPPKPPAPPTGIPRPTPPAAPVPPPSSAAAVSPAAARTTA